MALTGSQPAFVEARCGVEQCGNSRCGFFYPWPIVKIAGVDRTVYVDLKTLETVERLNAEPDECSFTIRKRQNFSVSEGQSVVVALGNDQPSLREFSGYITRLVQRFENGRLFYDVSAEDATRILNKYRLTKTYTNLSATAIARDIANVPGITATHIQENLPTVDLFIAEDMLRSEALSELAKRAEIDGDWYLEAASTPDLHFFQDESALNTQPQAITNATVPGYIKALRIEGEQTQIRTRGIAKAKRTKTLLGSPGAQVDTDVSISVDYLIVAGGGGGYSGTFGGGGGAGGLLQGTDLLSIGSYAVVVGSGGAAGSNGNNSSFNAHTATGGGAGGGTSKGGDGGSGGGGGSIDTRFGSGTVLQGYNGGSGDSHLGGCGGGGGGIGGQGGFGWVDVPGTVGGAGGAGIVSYITGAAVAYAGGGGGEGTYLSGAGGSGVGGTGGIFGSAGTANRGGGGGARGWAGGSGVVIVSYVTGSITATGGSVSTTSGGRTVHTFTANDTFSITAVAGTGDTDTVTDLPIEDKAQLVSSGGSVRVGTQLVLYASTGGPTKGTGDNRPGSTLSANAAVGATSLSVTDTSMFTTAPGWAKVGDQFVRFASVAAGALNGLPASGYGSLRAAVNSGASVTWMDHLNLASATLFDPPVEAGVSVIQIISIDDTAAQAILVAAGDVDGVYEHVHDLPDHSYDGAAEVILADLAAFSQTTRKLVYTTRNRFHRAGRKVSVDLSGSIGSLSGVLTIQEVRVKGFDQITAINGRKVTAFPDRECVAAQVRLQTASDLIVR